MRVLQIIDNLNMGGAEKQFFDINTILLKDKDINSFFYFPCWDKTQELPEGLPCLKEKTLFFNKSRKIDFFKILNNLNRLILEVKPDIVHSWLYYSNLINILSYRNLQKRIISQRSDYKYYFGSGSNFSVKRRIMKFMNRKTDALVVNSLSNYDYLMKTAFADKGKINYIPNGISITEDLIKQDYSITDNTVNFLYIANLRKEKNHLFLIPFMKGLRRRYKFKLTLMGDGPLREDFLEKIDRVDLSDCIDYQGSVRDAYRKAKNFDIFIYPSLFDGLPNALMEAMACGLPAVSSSVGGCKDLVRHGENGFLFSPNNLSEFIGLTERLIQSKGLRERFGKNSIRDMKNNFSLENTVNKYKNLYNKILS